MPSCGIAAESLLDSGGPGPLLGRLRPKNPWVARCFGWLVPSHPFGGPVLAFLGTGLGYVALAECAFQVVEAGSGLASFWPSVGFVSGLLVLAPRNLRVWILAAVVPSEVLIDTSNGVSALAGLGFGLTDVVEVSLAAALLLLFAGRRPDGNAQRDFVALAAAGFLAPLAGAVMGAAVSVAIYPGSYGQVWLNWWLGDATGMLLLGPLVLSFARPPQIRPLLRQLPAIFEAGLVVGAAAAVFAGTRTGVEFLILLPLVLLAVRRGLRVTAVANVSFALVATILTGRGSGPLSAIRETGLRVVVLQAFITTTAFVAFLISASIAQRRLAEEALAELASQDPLTGLANRRLFVDQLDRAAERSRRSVERSAVVYFDLDGFKEINDRYGHLVGDSVLIEIGNRLRAQLRASDLAARLGGDEFAALLEPVGALDSAEATAKRVTQSLEKPIETSAGRINVGVSMGVGLVAGDSDMALHAADIQLYRDKALARTSTASRPALAQLPGIRPTADAAMGLG
jgi:diguanylate cyclase (GGDEF)-like protein